MDKVLIDNAYNIPDLDSPVRMVNPSTEVLIALSPERTYTTSGIKSFSPEQRQCYYSDEVQVGRFRQYSFHNCMSYKKTEFIRQACDCVMLSSPSEDSQRICNFKDIDCMEKVANRVADSANSTENIDNSVFCFPECEHYDYPLEVALGKLADNIFVNGLTFFDDVKLNNRSLLNVFFNDLVSTRYRRDVYLNWQNILAAFGGLLSLMLGFTLISGFDLLMFFTIRIAYESIMKKQLYKPQNKINVQEYQSKNNWMQIPTPRGLQYKETNKSDFTRRKY